MQQLGHTIGRHAGPRGLYTLGLQTAPTLSKTSILHARKVKRHETAHSPAGSLRYPATECRPTSLLKGENSDQLDSWLSDRQNAFNEQCRARSRDFLTVSFDVCLLDWICPLMMSRRRSAESMWAAGLSMEDAGRLASISAGLSLD